MEASVVQPGEAAPEAAGENGGAAEAPGVDLAPVLEQFGELKGVVDEMRTEMSQLRQPAEQQPEPEPEPEAPGDWFQIENPEWNPEHATQQLQQFMRDALARETAPLRQEVLNMRRQHEAAQLIQEFPELAEQERAREVVGQSEALAKQLAMSLGLNEQFAEALGTEPGFVRLAHMAAVAAKAAAEEQPPGSEEAHLEGGGGATPTPSEEDLGDRIVNAGGRKVLPW